MNFSALQETHRQLRLRLRVHAGGQAFTEATVSLPTAEDDEISFIRLVVWAYVLFQETGRVSLRFLKELPPFSNSEFPPEIVFLRTWATHNLLPEKESDNTKLKLAWGWLKQACGSSTPSKPADWSACFSHLCDSVGTVLISALAACDSLDSPVDGPRLRTELKKRLERNWDAYRFDEYVVSAAARLGFDGIEPVAFRARYLDAWRKVVAVADDASIERLLNQRIEKDLLDMMNGALPTTSREIFEKLALEDPRELGILMLALRSRARTSRDGLRALLDGLVEELQKPQGSVASAEEASKSNDEATGSSATK